MSGSSNEDSQLSTPAGFVRAIESLRPASVVFAIEARLGKSLRTHLEPEDIWQEAVYQAWRDRHDHQWNGRPAFRSWMLQIIDHRIRDAVDRLGAQKRGGGKTHRSLQSPGSGRDDEDVAFLEVVASTTPSRRAILREEVAAMRKALSELSPALAEVVRLRYMEGLTLQESACRLRVSESTVKRRWREGAVLFERGLRRCLGIDRLREESSCS